MTTANDERLTQLVTGCIEKAREQGWTGADSEYEHTAGDLEWVTDELGYLPTREQWKEVGLLYVGGGHLGDESVDHDS